MMICITQYNLPAKNLNMQEIAQNFPQYGGFEKCSSGYRILRSQFFLGLARRWKRMISSNHNEEYKDCKKTDQGQMKEVRHLR